MTLEGKRALVTGSSGGIGKAIALELVNLGAKIVIHYNSRQREAIELRDILGSSCLGVLHCDFLDPDTIPTFLNSVKDCCCKESSCSDDEEGCLDILVNNAGIVNKMALEDDNALSVWHETMAVNLHAPCQISNLALPLMKRLNDGGVIINVSSIHGEKSNEYMGAYAASKAALDSLTRTMAIEFAPHNIRVNAIAPGVVPVERTESYFQNPANMKTWTEKLPLQRVGTVEEIARACVSMIENKWLTGSIWSIDGGMMARANFPLRPRPDKPPT
eukprot:CAMPEP_0194225590 /NCGR_PEP_ID=MMETSP0156-20130528/39958_1 /TAXON_ID=33649 /ORGANISM="Thalassionema nitzschioides, Strain L26-B" /LENGTH=273 /DNA_ID=CAMNT_0038957601 /DNA_START=41 /DNA_END=865 /DNA_ORIENTATION=-